MLCYFMFLDGIGNEGTLFRITFFCGCGQDDDEHCVSKVDVKIALKWVMKYFL